MSNIISCAQYDYIEIACLHHYDVELTLNNGETIMGIAHNVKIVKNHINKQEVLQLILENKKMIEIELMAIHTIRAITSNSNFTEVILHSVNI